MGLRGWEMGQQGLGTGCQDGGSGDARTGTGWLGIGRQRLRVWGGTCGDGEVGWLQHSGVCHPVPLPRAPCQHGMLVVPVVANLGPLEDLTLSPNPDEVAEVFTLPLEHLLREENQGYTHFRTAGRYGYTLPVFLNGPHRIWGLTAIITELTLELLAPDLYCRKTHVPGRGITAPQKRA